MAKGKYEYWISPEGLLKLESWAREGLTDEQIASNIGIARSTLNKWKNDFSDISDALKKGKEIVDIQVENALLKRALGYSYEEITREAVLNPVTNKTEMKVTKIVTKEIKPDVTAQIFWLKNRKPEQWKDNQNLHISGLEDEKNKLDDILKQMRGDG